MTLPEKLTPRESQEEAIVGALAEVGRSNGYLLGDEPGAGKTLISVEFVLRGMAEHGWTRILFIALPDTHKQFAERIAAQSGGKVQARIMNGTTKAGRENYAAFMAKEEGVFIAGSHYLAQKDWHTVPEVDREGQPVWQKDPKTGRAAVDAEGDLIQKRKSERKGVFGWTARKPLDAVILDECHIAVANKKNQARVTLFSIKTGYRMAMSGTWFFNSVSSQWSVTRWIWPGANPETGESYIEPSHDRWKKQWLTMEPVYSKAGRVVESKYGTVERVVGEREPGAFVRTLPAYRRIENEDRAPAPEVIWVDPTPEQEVQMEDLERDLMTWVQTWQGDEAPLVVDVPIVLRARLRQVAIAALSLDVDPETGEERVYMADDAASAKLGPLRGVLDYWGDQQVGIFTDSRIGAHFIAKRMNDAGYKTRAWTGDLTRTERETLKQAFIAGEFQYLIGTVQSMGTGVDLLQVAANKVVWISKADGNPALNEQALARYFRPGRRLDNGGFQQVEIALRGSVDEVSIEALLAKAWSMRAAMNGGAMVA